MTYDPSIQWYLATAEERWGTPDENKKTSLVPYRIAPLDQALYGLDVVNGEMIIVQGEEKNRKTTLVENIIINYMLDPIPGGVVPLTVIDTLESGMKPEKYVDTLICNVASRKLISEGHMPNPTIVCSKCGGSGPCTELKLTHKYLRFNKRSPVQQAAIQWALDVMADWPLLIYGASVEQGDTRNLTTSVVGVENQMSRWEKLILELGAKVFVTDHLQQYDIRASGAYERMEMAITAHSNLVAKHNIVDFMISQVSLTSAREAASGMGKYTATGGRKAAQEGNTIFTTNYESGSGKMLISVDESRDAGSGWGVYQYLEEESGAFHGVATYTNNVQFRPGMGGGNNGDRQARK